MEKEKTLIDCIKEDNQSMSEIQKGLDLIMGHNLKQELIFYYRGKQFLVRMNDDNTNTSSEQKG